MSRKRLHITNSELGTWRTCRRKWELAYKERLSPKVRPRYFSVGSAVHAAADAMYSAMRKYRSLTLEQAKDLALKAAWKYLVTIEEWPAADEREAARLEALTAVELLVDTWWDDWKRFEVIDVERPFDVPLRDTDGSARAAVRVRGIFDLVLRDRETGEIFLGEHKTTAGAAYALELRIDVDPQLATYLYAASDVYGVPVRRVVYNIVRKRPPATPKINRDGSVSAAAIDTTQAIYAAALDAQKKPITDKQRERLASLPETMSRWAHRIDCRIPDSLVQAWQEDALADAGLIRLYHRGKLRASRNGASCRHPITPECPYRALCLRAHPEIVAAEYDRRIHRHPELDGDDVETVEPNPPVSNASPFGF